jgi:putative ABC transport system permease protein
MFTFIKLAWRNIFRFKRRTIITFVSISLGLGLLIITICLMNGIDKQSISNIINCQTSHLKIFKEGYFEKRDELPMELMIKNPDRIRSLLKGIPGIEGTESRVLFGASIIKGMDEMPCLGVAVDPEVDPGLFIIKESIIDGAWLEPDDAKIVVGRDMAEDIGLSVGDSVTIRMITATGEEDFSWNALDLEIKGIFDSGHPAVDNIRIIIPMQQASESLSLDSEVTEIVVRLRSDDDRLISTVKNKVEEVLKSQKENFEVVTWKDLAGTFLAVSKMKTQRSAIIIFIMLIIASVGIINTMLMAVFERTREIGMFAAMGMKKSEIMKLFVFVGGFIGVIGSLLGCILGALGSWYLEVEGWSFTSMGETLKKVSEAVYPIKDVYYADLTMDVLVIIFIFGVVISLAAGVYPAYKAAKLNPIDALRHI